jgi:hypothetical protein
MSAKIWNAVPKKQVLQCLPAQVFSAAATRETLDVWFSHPVSNS